MGEEAITLGLTGDKEAGKSTFAKALTEYIPESDHLESRTLVTQVANRWLRLVLPSVVLDRAVPIDYANAWIARLPGPVKDVTSKDFTVGQLLIDDVLAEEEPKLVAGLWEHLDMFKKSSGLLPEITAENKNRFRPLLSWLGGYLVKRGDEGVWYDKLTEQAQKAVHKGAKLVSIDGLRFAGDEARCRHIGAYIIRVIRPGSESDGSVTEQSQTEIKEDIRVYNDSTLSHLGKTAVRVLTDIKAGTVEARTSDQPLEYYASKIPTVV